MPEQLALPQSFKRPFQLTLTGGGRGRRRKRGGKMVIALKRTSGNFSNVLYIE